MAETQTHRPMRQNMEHQIKTLIHGPITPLHTQSQVNTLTWPTKYMNTWPNYFGQGYQNLFNEKMTVVVINIFINRILCSCEEK